MNDPMIPEPDTRSSDVTTGHVGLGQTPTRAAFDMAPPQRGTPPGGPDSDPATVTRATTAPIGGVGAHVRQVDTSPRHTTTSTVDLADPALGFIAATLDDLEGVRKSLANRLRILTTLDADDDGIVRGFGLPDTDPGVVAVTGLLGQVEGLEDEAKKALERRMKAHPLGPWVMSRRGVGLKTMGRTLGLLGDPAWHPVLGQPRTFGQLKSYAGLAPRDGASPKRRKGQQVTWNGGLRMRLWNAVQPAIRTHGPYRDVYEAARADVAERIHLTDCAQCGHQPAGSPWKPSHQHGHAVHMMMVALLRDLWIEARRLHGWDDEAPDATPSPCDPTCPAGGVGTSLTLEAAA